MAMKKSNSTASVSAPARPGVQIDLGQRYFYAGAVIATLISLVTYVRTMAPSASFWDSGEFIATSYILGVPHSPGTPLYVLVGRVFTMLPLPFSIAGRVNFMSVLTGALGVLFAYLLIIRFLDHIIGRSVSVRDTLLKVVAGLVGALFITFSHTYWTNSTEAEVYAMSVFLMALTTWIGLKWSDNPTGPRSNLLIYLLFYLLALTVGLHLGTVLAFSGLFFFVLMTEQKSFGNGQFLLAFFAMAIFVVDATLIYAMFKQDAEMVTISLLVIFAALLFVEYGRTKSTFALTCTLLFLLGISVHYYLMIRSGHNPAIDEADPENWRNLYAVLRREQYPPANPLVRKAGWLFQFKHFNNYFQSQFQMASAYVGTLNIGSVVPLAMGIWGMVDHYSKHRKTFVMLFVTLVVVSLGMIVYLNFSDAEVRERDYFYLPAFYYFGIFIGIGAGSLLTELRNFAAKSGVGGNLPVVVAAVVLLAMPLFTAKHHYHMHDRSNDYVCPEYAKNLLAGLEENALIFTNGDNDTFPLWYIQEVEKYRKDIRVVNLSLLNTPWYIKQLKYNEPKVTIAWTDLEIENLRPIRTREGTFLIRDIGVRHILQHNVKNRPIYFSVTIPPETYAPYRDMLEMQGMVYQVVPRKGENMINEEILERNIWENYNYAGILDENWKRDKSMYQPPFVQRLLQNYAAAFTQLAFVRAQKDDFESVVKNLEVAREIAPNMDAVVLWIGWYYFEAGDTTRAIEYYKQTIEERPDLPELFYRLAGVYERLDDLPAALAALEELLRRDPNHRDACVSAIGIAMRLGDTDHAQRLLNTWLAAHPNDAGMQSAWERLRQSIAPEEGSAPSEQ